MTRYAFVTGADRGLGFALAESLLQRHYYVFAGQYGTDNEALEELADRYQESCTVVSLDVSDDASVAAAAQTIEAVTDKLDLLINNAGILGDIEATILDPLPFEEIQQVFNINTLGPLRVTNALAPLILRSEMKLFANISSEAGSIARSHRDNWFGYSMSKAALNMQGSIIHNKVKPLGGQVLLIHPGWVKSYLHGEYNAQADLTAERSADEIIQRIEELDGLPTEEPLYFDYRGDKWPW